MVQLIPKNEVKPSASITGADFTGNDGDTNRTYTLLNPNVYPAFIILFIDGAPQLVDRDFTISGQEITYLKPLYNDAKVDINYFVSSSSTIIGTYPESANLTPRHEPEAPDTLTGANFTGSNGDANRTYALKNDNAYASFFLVTVDGAPLYYVTDFTLSNNVLTILRPLYDDALVDLNYFTADEASALTVQPTYCSATDVARILQKQSPFTSSTTPSLAEVNMFINSVEDNIDKITRHAWREKTVTNEYYDVPELPYNYSTGQAIFLKHRRIRTLSSADGDKLEIWQGDSWADWLATKTEGRNKDYWLEDEQGVLYIRNPFAYHTKRAIRLTYRYGETSVPTDIRDAAALMTAALILSSDDRSMVVAETGDSTRSSHDRRIELWEKRAERLLANHKEFSVW